MPSASSWHQEAIRTGRVQQGETSGMSEDLEDSREDRPQADATMEEPDANRQRPGRRSASIRPASRAAYQFPVRNPPVGRLARRSRGLARPARLAPGSERLAGPRAGALPRTAPGQASPPAPASAPMGRAPAAPRT